jgi:hypothetical protein
MLSRIFSNPELLSSCERKSSPSLAEGLGLVATFVLGPGMDGVEVIGTRMHKIGFGTKAAQGGCGGFN